MSLNLRKVAIIGGGVSGVVAGKHLRAANVDVTIYERSSGYGGVWVYEEKLPQEPPYPSAKPSIADFDQSKIEPQQAPEMAFHDEEAEGKAFNELTFSPPGPCYESLRNNVPTPLVKLRNHPWPDGTPDFVLHSTIKDYIIEAGRRSELELSTRFDTRVERVWKESEQWRVASRKLARNESGQLSSCVNVSSFDGVVVASGHYHAARVPDIPGLSMWKTKHPQRIIHSKLYRKAIDYKDQNVFLLGAGTSSTDIARELVGIAKNIFQSSRGGSFDLPIELLPIEADRVAGISFFSPLTETVEPVDRMDPLPGNIHLQDGTILQNIHRIIVCTGYHISLPFLTQFHADDVNPSLASPETIVTDGTQYHNLHEDIFHIPDPTLAFIGVPYYTATFSLFEFQAIALAEIWTGGADLPSEGEMRKQYLQRVKTVGMGRGFNSLKGKEKEYVDRIFGWINQYARQRNRKQLIGHDEDWVYHRTQLAEKMKERLAAGARVEKNSGNQAIQKWLEADLSSTKF